MSGRRPFGATYRLQCNGVGFARATELVPYLHDLGVATLYLSPVTRATNGSTHGYDVIDPTVLDPALGGPDAFEVLLAALAAHDMTALLDIVPNHMAASLENAYFQDVLAHGRDSTYARWFDIDWERGGGRIILPFLDGDSGDVPGLAPSPHYELIDWREANQRVNYRRFFDINGLIGVRQEDPAVFDATHALVADLAADPRVAGVRVDHVDGMRDPAGYLQLLRELIGPEPVILVEKILEVDESMPPWPVDGTTGYEFAAAVIAGLVDPAGARRIAELEHSMTGDDRPFVVRARTAKSAALAASFPHQLEQVASTAGEGVAAAPGAVTDAVAQLTASLAVYRTYRRAGEPLAAEDRRWVEAAADDARSRVGPPTAAAIDQLLSYWLGELDGESSSTRSVMDWQQLSSPAAAKGVEDTALYTPGTLLANADVGADPDAMATLANLIERAASSSEPTGLLALSTHDSKRSADVRCRLAALSETPEQWERAVAELERLAGPTDAPDGAERHYLYQTLVGAWPLDGVIDEGFSERIEAHVVKAAREAKRHTSWTAPDEAHEAALEMFARSLLADSERRALLDLVVDDIACAGATNSLTAVVLRSLLAGVADIYQGDEVWNLALVDPDNRRRRDWTDVATTLRDLPDVVSNGVTTTWRDGRVKQLVARNLLRWRRSLGASGVGPPQLLRLTGRWADAVLAIRVDTDAGPVVGVMPTRPRRTAGGPSFAMGDCWGDTSIALPGGSDGFVDLLTGLEVDAGDTIRLADATRALPVAVLRARS